MSTLLQAPPSPTLSTIRKPRLPALTGIRAFVSMDIVFFHFSNPKWFGPLAPLVDGGFVGVSFFFVLSGFILSYNYGDREKPLRLGEFWRTRLARLYPIYVLSLLVSARVLAQEWTGQTRAHFFEGLTLTPLMLQGWSPALATFWNTPGWTLSCEVFFYALLPWLVGLRWPRPGPGSGPGSERRLVGLLALLWIAGMALPALYTWLKPDGIANVDRYTYGFWLRAVKFMPVPHLPEFLFGMTLARWNTMIRWSGWTRMGLAVGGLLGALGVMKASGALSFVFLHDGLLMPVFGMVLLGLAGEHPLASFFAFRPFVALGEASYCLYLLHFNLWLLVHDYHVWDALRIAWLDPWLSYAFVIAAALAAYRWVEQPGRKWMMARLGASEGG